MPFGMEKCSVRVVIARTELKSLLELLVQREIIVVQQLADAFGAAACVILDGLGEHLLLGVEVVVGEPRSHASCTRYALLLDILLSDMRFQALQEYTKANI